jgi:dUTP pyrophosphatase
MEATMYLYVDKAEPELLEMYKKQIQEHNEQIDTNPFPNSGFDLLLPQDTTIWHNNNESYFIDFKIKTEMTFTPLNNPSYPSAFYVYPRSSLSKTSLMLSNHVGVIDSGYRGNIKGAFRCLDGFSHFNATKFTRLVQICHPSLCKIRVILVENETDLSTTLRGSGGFGSTGV